MHLIQSLKNQFCFDLPMFSKYPATSINGYFYKMTLRTFIIQLQNSFLLLSKSFDQYSYRKYDFAKRIFSI